MNFAAISILHLIVSAVIRPACDSNRFVIFASAFQTSVLRGYPCRRIQTVARTSDILTCFADPSDHPKEDHPNSTPTTGSARTGWKHNLPGPNSSFWIQDEKVHGASSSSFSSSSTDTPITDRPKTGWLHYKQNINPTPLNHTTTTSVPLQSRQIRLEANRVMQSLPQSQFDHRLLAAPVFHPCGANKVAVVTEHSISVPLHYNQNQNTDDRIDIFFTLVEPLKSQQDETFLQRLAQAFLHTHTPSQAAQSYMSHFHSSMTANPLDASKCLLYLQGGPGFGAPTPIANIGLTEKSSWLGEVLFGQGATLFHRVLLMDSRGTGRSSPITKQSLEIRYPDLFLLDSKDATISSSSTTIATCVTNPPLQNNPCTDELTHWEKVYPEITSSVRRALVDATDFMAQFRADHIVRDAESLKEALFQNDHGPTPYGGVLGQSYGGFCIFTYLSLVQQPPKLCLITGGIPPIFTPVDQVYNSLWKKVKKRNELFYKRYPGDVALVKRIVQRLMDQPEPLPSKGILTARRFLQLGISLGGSPTSFASLHHLLSTAFVSDKDDIFSKSFLKSIDSTQPFDDHPIYCLLHESIYADGVRHSNPTSWAAYQVFQRIIEQYPELDYAVTSQPNRPDRTMFFGEVVFPWMCEGDFAELSGFGMRALANALAYKSDWGQLYDCARIKQVLSDDSGISKAAAAIYYDDMYVDLHSSLQVVDDLQDTLKVWITNDYQHSGLRDDGSFIVAKLIGMLNGAVGTPS